MQISRFMRRLSCARVWAFKWLHRLLWRPSWTCRAERRLFDRRPMVRLSTQEVTLRSRGFPKQHWLMFHFYRSFNLFFLFRQFGYLYFGFAQYFLHCPLCLRFSSEGFFKFYPRQTVVNFYPRWIHLDSHSELSQKILFKPEQLNSCEALVWISNLS